MKWRPPLNDEYWEALKDHLNILATYIIIFVTGQSFNIFPKRILKAYYINVLKYHLMMVGP